MRGYYNQCHYNIFCAAFYNYIQRSAAGLKT
jgi:hypothetical protein